MSPKTALLKLLFVSLMLLFAAHNALAQGSAFTYQGRLTDGGTPPTGSYELEFKLFDAASGGTQQPQPAPVTIQLTGAQAVAVNNGVFTVQLDFGANAFPGAARYLEIGVRHVGDATFTRLSPRQPITATPYAIRSVSATTAVDFSGTLNGDVTGTQSATVVSSVGGESAVSLANGATAANNATNTNTAGAIVKRDASGNFAAGTITATLDGNATSATTATTATTATNATNFTGSLAGDVTGTQGATVVSSVGGQSASSVASGAAAASAATNTNTASTIVKRDASGNFSAGTITASLDGNATTATTATTANTATTATTASGVSAAAGDSVVTAINASSSTINAARLPSGLATQNGSNTFSGTNTFSTSPTFSAGLSADGQRVTNVGTPTAASDAATKAYVDANAASTTAGGDLTGSYPNPSIATTAVAGTNIIAAVNASGSAITTAHVSGDVELAPSAQQTTSSTNNLINLKLIGTRTLGEPGQDALLSLSASGTYPDNNTYDKERFRVDNDGSILAVGDYDGGLRGAPAEGAGTRFMWYAAKAAIRAGQINGTQWDDANIGLYSTSFGENVRALGDNSIAMGRNTVAAGSRTVALGEGNTATGYASVALGYGASTSTSAGSPRNGTFVFSDFSTPLTYFGSSVDSSSQFHPSVTNSFNVRAVNGSFFYTNTALTTGFIFNSTTATMTLTNSKLTMASDGSTTLTSNSGGSAGVTLPAGGGSWNNLSDRNMKANFAAVDTRAILRGVLGLPISTWNYKTQDKSIRHIGPMAQDFFATFKVGEGDKTIATIDPDGVALAAIQGLHEELKDRDAKIGGLQQQVKSQQEQIDGLKKLL
ncbi:MAG TPA: tail fiber domain-containing protein, partial [Pyrinomonadaceae bacterium]|nr:tail fiber domain-containing protein [Pyrinomonadaceae bacterium]